MAVAFAFFSFQSFAKSVDGVVKVKDAKIIWKGFKSDRGP